jgi:malonyl-CoA decarboxylase
MDAMSTTHGPDPIERRAELLAEAPAAGTEAAAELASLTEHLGILMGSGELVVRRLTLHEPAEVLDRLVAAEPVHPFAGPDDVADRLDEDRRCFVLEHPSLPGRPLNTVWCALWPGVPDDLAAILDPAAPTGDPAAADTAVFYSIWNVEPGLVGLPGGRTLLLGAVVALRDELPGLSTFVTLSPVPGFRAWLGARDSGDPQQRLVECARYLTTLRDDGRPIDSVARFHLGNGARLLAIAADADRSGRGMERSFGIMANYRYEPEDRDANRASLAEGQVAVGEQVAELLRDPGPPAA